MKIRYFHKIVFFLAILLLGTGCRTVQVVPESSIVNHHDTIIRYLHDSIARNFYHTVYQRGDTVFIHDSVDRIKIRLQKDTIISLQTDTIYRTITKNKVNKWTSFLECSGYIFWGALLLLIICIIGRLLLRKYI